MRSVVAMFTFLIVCFSPASSYADSKYMTDVNQLPAEQQQLYKQAYELNQNLIQDWSKATEANHAINDLIIAAPNFLPIYVEKARYMVMEGYIKRTNIQTLKKDVLAVLQDVEKKAPDFPAPYVLAAHVYTFSNDFPAAEKSLLKAQQFGSTDTWLYNNWADLLKRQGKNAEALQYALKGFKTAGSNKKAISSSISVISVLRPRVQEKISTQELLNLILETYKDPQTRLFIAKSFTKSFVGDNSEAFVIAAGVIAKVRESKTDLKECDLEEARLVMGQGYLVHSKFADRFTPESIAQARSLLMPLRDDPALTEDAYGMLISLAFSEQDRVLASHLMDEADRNQTIPDNFISRNRGQESMMFGEYALGVYFYEEVEKTDPSIKYSNELTDAYASNNQQDKVEEYHIRNVEWNPDNAWANGNYGGYLLQIKGDADKSLKYTRKALSIMNYPLARQNLMLELYLKWANILINEKDAKKAQPYFDEAYAIMPDMAYVVDQANKWPTTQIITTALKKTGLYKE